MIWFKEASLDEINKSCENTLVDYMQITVTRISEDELEGEMPVTQNTKQPFGILHGGVNCVLAETIGSLAANLVLDPEKQHAVGLTIHTNHLKAVRNGKLRCIGKPIHIGGKTHLWKLDTFNDQGDLTSQTQLTMAIIDKLN